MILSLPPLLLHSVIETVVLRHLEVIENALLL